MTIPRSIEASRAHEMLEAIGDAFTTYDAAQVWPAVTAEFHAGVADNFVAEESAAGVQWPPRKDNKPHPLLRKSRKMITAATTSGAGGFVRSDAQWLEVGINLDVIPYARAQNFGHLYQVRGRTWYLPPREYYYASEERIEAMGRILADDLLQTLSR